MIVDVVIPALNEEQVIGQVVQGLLRTCLVRDVWVVDNGSEDQTAAHAAAAPPGARGRGGRAHREADVRGRGGRVRLGAALGELPRRGVRG